MDRESKRLGKLLGEIEKFGIDVWQECRDFTKYVVSGVVARLVLVIAAWVIKLIGGENIEYGWITTIDSVSANVIFLLFVAAGAISFILNVLTKNWYSWKKSKLEYESEYILKEKEFKSRLFAGDVDSIPGKAGKIIAEIAQDIEDFDPEDE